MDFKVHGFENGGPIPGEFAFCVPADEGHVALAPNKNPKVSWSDIPERTKSLVLLCVDPDVPSKPDDVNQEGKTVPKELPRIEFSHWVLIDIPPSISEIAEGADSNGITPHGKPAGKRPYGVTGINNYTDWFKGDENMGGFYGGYDGPCPPWNDSIIHHYQFYLYALNCESLGLSGNFGYPEVMNAMAGHIIGAADWIGTYTLNKEMIK